MRGFSELIGCKDRYIEDKTKMLDASCLIKTLEKAMEEGYDHELIDAAKKKTYVTLENIVDDK